MKIQGTETRRKKLDRLNASERNRPFTSDKQWKVKTTEVERRRAEDWWNLHGRKKLVAMSLTLKRTIPEYNEKGDYIKSHWVLDNEAARSCIAHFAKVLDRRLPIGGRRNRLTIPKIFVMESKDGVPHLHGVVAIPEHKLISTAVSQISECWSKCHLAGDQNAILTRYEDEETGEIRRVDAGWVSYILKMHNYEDLITHIE